MTQAIRNVQLLAPNAVPRKTRPCQAADFQAVFQLLRQLWPDKDLDIARVHQRKRAAGRAHVHRLPTGTVGVAVAVGLGVTVEVGVGVTVGVTVAVAVAVGVGVGLGDAMVLNVLSPPGVVPPLLVATIRKWYVVLPFNPEMFALTLWYVFPLLVWDAVVDP